MSWYTRGPAGLEYKYGNVISAARHSGVGVLGVAPRLHGNDEIEDLEFLADLQAAVERAGLPWRHQEFSRELDKSGLFIAVPLDFDPEAKLAELGQLLAEHVGSVRQAFAAATGEPSSFDELSVSMDVLWVVAPEQVPALLDWVNAPLPPDGWLTLDRLRKGRHGSWYEPPDELAAGFKLLADEESDRHLAAHALAHLAHDDRSGFWLEQPDDDTFRVAWRQAGAVLYRPADHPFVDLLADVFGVRPAVRERVFYAYVYAEPDPDSGDGGDRVALPPEEDVPAEDLHAGMAFARHFGRILDWIVDHGFRPTRKGGCRMMVGWHAGASFDELTEAFEAAGWPARTLDDVLADRRAAWEHMPTRSRLSACAGDVDGNPFAFVLHGGDDTPEASTDDIAVLLVLLDQLDLDEPELNRLRQVLRPVAAAAAERTG